MTTPFEYGVFSRSSNLTSVFPNLLVLSHYTNFYVQNLIYTGNLGRQEGEIDNDATPTSPAHAAPWRTNKPPPAVTGVPPPPVGKLLNYFKIYVMGFNVTANLHVNLSGCIISFV